MSKILISYRREDSADVTGRIYDRLVQVFPQSVFRDVDSIPLGVDFRSYLDEQVAKCDVFLAVIGRNWMKAKGRKGKSRLEDPGDFVRIEIESALKRRIPIIPVLVSGAAIPPVDRLPASLQDLSYRHGVVVRPDPDFHRDMDRLIDHLRAQLEGKQEHLPLPAAQHTGGEVSATGGAAHSEVERLAQESVEAAVSPTGLDSQPEVKQPHEEASIALLDAQRTASDGSLTGEETHSEAERLEQEGVETAVPPSGLDSHQREVEQVEEGTSCFDTSSPATTDRSQSYIFGGIGLIALIGAVVAFLILQPKPSFVTPPVKKHVNGSEPRIPSPQMVRISPGSFMMGGSGDESEAPIHKVQFAKPFAIARYETTFDEYDRFAQATGRKLPNDEGWGRGQRPVINVSWDDAKAYAQWLSQQTGKRYRLPTESEWEYAARSDGKEDEIWAGTSDESQLKDYAVYRNRMDRTEPVGSKKPNGLGLYDMSGNVQEWVEDCWHKNYKGAPEDGSVWLNANEGDCENGGRVIRGGSWWEQPANVRTSSRSRYYFEAEFAAGFRLAQDIP